MPDINILIGRAIEHGDVERLFGPLDSTDRTLFYLDSSITLGIILSDAGLFKSRKDAKRSGWDREIPWGWSEFRVGKLKTLVCCWKPDRATVECEETRLLTDGKKADGR